MDLLEYQGKQFLAAAGVAVPEGIVATSTDDAVEGARSIGYPLVLKAQVRTGGRGKAGGIRLASDEVEVAEHAAAMLGADIRGHRVELLWLEKATAIAAEHYVSWTFDRSARMHVALVSAAGGVDIEEVAISRPEAVARLHVDPLEQLAAGQAVDLVRRAGLGANGTEDELAAVVDRLFRAYVHGDAELVEVNPLVVTTDGGVIALDAKITLDDSAAFRHPEWSRWSGGEGADPRERMAAERGLNYVGLDGTVGVIGNGAGLVMATLDVVQAAGGRAANFLDVGGGAGADVITAALDVVNQDEKVRCIFVNIFGGITRCDQVALGIVEAVGRLDMRSPIVVRLDGTNAAEGRAILAASALEGVVERPTMLDAARAAVELAASGDRP